MSGQRDDYGNEVADCVTAAFAPSMQKTLEEEEVRDPRLTHSRLRCARKCMRLHYWLYECGLRPVREASPLRIGSAYHRGLELMATMERDEAIAAACAPYDEGPPAGSDEEFAASWWVERATVACLLAGHHWRWDEADETEPTISTETVFDIPLVNPVTGRPSRTWRLCGRRDAIIGTDNDRLLIREYKTTSNEIDISTPAGEVFWTRLRMDSQVSTYWIAALAEGMDVQGVIYDVTRKPAISPRQIPLLDADGLKIVLDEVTGERATNKNGTPRQSAGPGLKMQTRVETPEEFGERLWADIVERPDHYFARREIPRLDADLQEAGVDMWRMASILRQAQLEARTMGKTAWPRNTDSCMTFGRCPCWNLCTGGYTHGIDPLPEGWRVVEDVHPELEED